MADTLLGGIAINEILVDPNGAANFDTDGSGAANHTDEFVELRNLSDSAIDISGLELWDHTIGHWFTFPPGTVLQPGAHALVIAGVQPGGSLPSGGPNDLAFDAGRSGAVINNGGDNVVVYDPSNDEFIQARFNGDALDDPTGGSGYSGFSSTATRSGSGEDFGNDIDGYSLQRAPSGGDTIYNDETPTPAAQNVCFCSGTLIASPRGPVPVERLRPGDLIDTLDNGAQVVTWTCSRLMAAQDLRQNPKLRPVTFPAGSLGSGLPNTRLLVSPQHRMLVRGPVAARMFARDEVLVAAKSLIGINGIATAQPDGPIVYHHIALAAHEVIFANGALSESFFPGRQALRALPDAARTEFFAIFPQLLTGAPDPARKLVQVRKGRQLALRHARNGIGLSDGQVGGRAP